MLQQKLMVPSNYKLIYSASQIQGAVQDLAKQVSAWVSEVHQRTGRDVVAVPLLRGGMFFYCDLVRQVPHSLELVPVKTSTYVEGVNAAELARVKIDMAGLSASGRSVLLVDDICDSGRTLVELKEQVLQAGAAEVRSAALIRRKLARESFLPDWVGFEYNGPEWFVGYGMEDQNRWRNLPDVYVIGKV